MKKFSKCLSSALGAFFAISFSRFLGSEGTAIMTTTCLSFSAILSFLVLAGAAVGIGNVFLSLPPTFGSYSLSATYFALLYYYFLYLSIYLNMRGIDRALADLYGWQKREEESIRFFLLIGLIVSAYLTFLYCYQIIFPCIKEEDLVNPLQVVVQLSCFFFNFKWRGEEKVMERHLTFLCFLGGVLGTLYLKNIHFGLVAVFISILCLYAYLFRPLDALSIGLLFYMLDPGLAKWGFYLLFQQVAYYALSISLERKASVPPKGVIFRKIFLLFIQLVIGGFFYNDLYWKVPAKLAALVSGTCIIYMCLNKRSHLIPFILYLTLSLIIGLACEGASFDGILLFSILHLFFLWGFLLFKKSLPPEKRHVVLPLFFCFFGYILPWFPHLEWLEKWIEGLDLLLCILSLFVFIEESQAKKIEDITAGTGKASG